MKTILLILTLLVSFSAQAVLVCPELQGSYTCGETNPIRATILQYEDDNNNMNYEMFNDHFVADGKKHKSIAPRHVNGEYVAKCDYEKLKIKYTAFREDGSLFQTERILLTRLSASTFELKSIIHVNHDPYPTKVHRFVTNCTLN